MMHGPIVTEYRDISAERAEADQEAAAHYQSTIKGNTLALLRDGLIIADVAANVDATPRSYHGGELAGELDAWTEGWLDCLDTLGEWADSATVAQLLRGLRGQGVGRQQLSGRVV